MAGDGAVPDSGASPIPAKDPRTIARSYQLELCKKAVEQNTIVYLETGCGKTHIAVMLMYELRHRIAKPSDCVCVFLAPTVQLVNQQSVVIRHSTDFKVGTYVGDDKRPREHYDWEKELQQCEVLVMTPQILFRNLEHCFMRMEQIALLIFDECHHAHTQNRHPYGLIMKNFYKNRCGQLPRIFGMTASPIMGKSGSSSADYSKCINSLEDLLDAKVCTVNNKDELESYISSPHIKIYPYDPMSYNAFHSDLVFDKTLEKIKDECIKLAKGSSYDLKEIRKKTQSIHSLYDNVKYCCEELGQLGGAKAVQILLRDVEPKPVETEKDTDNDPIMEYLTQASAAFDPQFMNDFSASPSFQSAALEEPFFSKKLLVLIRILSSHREREGLKCIIFVKRIIVARSLASIIGCLASLSHWNCEFLVGIHSGVKNVSRISMKKIVEDFQSGKLNLIVATNVAEEGLDIQTCCLVIRFDLPETVTSFIQSRGRARMQQSEFVFLVERDNLNHLNLINDFTTSESLINDEVKQRTSIEKFHNVVEERYNVNKTGASIGAGSSISLLHHYCAKLPSDEFFIPRPSFFYMDDVGGTFCRILLPPNAAIRQVDGPPWASKDDAKRMACLEACKRLHELGCLTDYLLPFSKRRKSQRRLDTSSELRAEFYEEEIYEMLIPNVLQDSWSEAEDSVSLNFYFFKLTPIPDDRSYHNFGLFLKSPLPEEAENMMVNLYLLQNRMVKVELVPSGVVTFDRSEVAHAEKFQEMWLKIILERHLLFADYISLGLKECTEMEGLKFYLLLPVKMDGKQGNYVVDWTIVTGYLSSPLFTKRTYNTHESGSLNGKETLRFENGDFDVRHIPNSVITTSHTNLVYCVIDVLKDVNGYSKRLVSTSTETPSYTITYEEIFKRNNMDLLHPEQPFLKVKQLYNLKNLLQDRGHDEKTMFRNLPEHFVELPPEVCSLKILLFSKEVASTLSLLPSVMHRLENLLVAIELKNLLSTSFPEASLIPASRILQALTTEKCSESFSLERLEILGDSFLKYAVGRHLFLSEEFLDEGKLTQLRSERISNLNFYELSVKNNLQVYIRDYWFDPTHYYILGRPCPVQCNKANDFSIHFEETSDKIRRNLVNVRCSKNHHFLQRKTIADMVEALVGLFILDVGFRAANAFLRWIGIPIDFPHSDVENICLASKNSLSLLNLKDFHEIEDLLEYKFKWKGILVEAFTHPSQEKHHGGCYQRLEFLGDAVLDYLITSYLYTVYPNLSPGQLTDLRSLAVNNNSLSRLAVAHSLQSYIISDSVMLSKAIEKYAKFVQLPSEEQNFLEEPKCPKVLSDIVESCTGAIYLDSGLNLDVVWKIMLPFMSSAVRFSNVQLNPIRELYELCQSCNCKLNHETKKLDTGMFSYTKEVNISGITFSGHAISSSKKMAERNASLDLLAKLKDGGHALKFELVESIIHSTLKDTPMLIGYDETPVSLDSPVLVQTRAAKGVERRDLVVTSDGICTAREKTMTLTIQGSDPSPEPFYFIGHQLTAGSAKSRLYETCSVNCWDPPLFTCCSETGPSHLKLFTYKVVIKLEEATTTILECIGEPHAKKKAAVEDAAEGAMWYLLHRGIKR